MKVPKNIALDEGSGLDSTFKILEEKENNVFTESTLS